MIYCWWIVNWFIDWFFLIVDWLLTDCWLIIHWLLVDFTLIVDWFLIDLCLILDWLLIDFDCFLVDCWLIVDWLLIDSWLIVDWFLIDCWLMVVWFVIDCLFKNSSYFNLQNGKVELYPMAPSKSIVNIFYNKWYNFPQHMHFAYVCWLCSSISVIKQQVCYVQQFIVMVPKQCFILF